MNLTKSCCIDWNEFNVELKNRIIEEINSIVTEKGIPKSIFSVRLNTINNLHRFCPACGEGLLETEKHGVEPPRDSIAAPKSQPSPQAPISKIAPKSYPDIKCPVCKGVGDRGSDERGIKMMCGKCTGLGYFPGAEYEIVEQEYNGVLQKVIKPRGMDEEKLSALEHKREEISRYQEKVKPNQNLVNGVDL